MAYTFFVRARSVSRFLFLNMFGGISLCSSDDTEKCILYIKQIEILKAS